MQMRKELHFTKNYQVDIEGNVYNTRTGHKKRLIKQRSGYFYVELFKNNKAKRYLVHRLVAKAFIPNPENKPQVNHKDGNKTNNHVSNLEWVTNSENQLHAFSMGLQSDRKGENNNWTSLSDEDVEEICSLMEQGYRNKEIRLKYQVSSDILKNIRSGRGWKHISCRYSIPKRVNTASEETVRWVCEKIVEGFGNIDIVNMSSNPRVNKSFVSKIRRKETFTEISKEYIF